MLSQIYWLNAAQNSSEKAYQCSYPQVACIAWQVKAIFRYNPWVPTPWAQYINWTHIKSSEGINDIFWTSYVRATYALCPMDRPCFNLMSLWNVSCETSASNFHYQETDENVELSDIERNVCKVVRKNVHIHKSIYIDLLPSPCYFWIMKERSMMVWAPNPLGMKSSFQQIFTAVDKISISEGRIGTNPSFYANLDASDSF